MIDRVAIANLKQYAITLTTSYEAKHGVCGHMFEMIEYFMHFRFHKNINACILITDGTDIHDFFDAITNKYDLTSDELKQFADHTQVAFQPKVILANTLLIVDGSLRTHGADLLAEKIVLLRCADEDIVRDDVLILQDNDVYDPLPNSQHYKKKILFEKFKRYDATASNTAMFYLTTNCRAIADEEIQRIINKDQFDHYIAISNGELDLTGVDVLRAPVDNIWSKFNTYIYTSTAKKFDCSPRFIVECAYYGKDVIYEIDYFDKGLEVRRQDLAKGLDILALTADDEISSRI
jgi:hypothetical protein